MQLHGLRTRTSPRGTGRLRPRPPRCMATGKTARRPSAHPRGDRLPHRGHEARRQPIPEPTIEAGVVSVRPDRVTQRIYIRMTSESTTRDLLARSLDWSDACTSGSTRPCATSRRALRGTDRPGCRIRPGRSSAIRIAQRDILDFSAGERYEGRSGPPATGRLRRAAGRSGLGAEPRGRGARTATGFGNWRGTPGSTSRPSPRTAPIRRTCELILVVDHTAYHVGQLVLVRRLWALGRLTAAGRARQGREDRARRCARVGKLPRGICGTVRRNDPRPIASRRLSSASTPSSLTGRVGSDPLIERDRILPPKMLPVVIEEITIEEVLATLLVDPGRPETQRDGNDCNSDHHASNRDPHSRPSHI